MGWGRDFQISLRNQFSPEDKEAEWIHVTSDYTDCIKTKDTVKKQ